MGLDSEQQRKLDQGSRLAIRGVLPGLEKYWKGDAWLSNQNPYRENCVEQINKDFEKNQSFDDKQLAEYVAASAIVHCFDGWSYLGRAMEAEMASDPDVARHLGYYAQLRAAMSVLAGDGIGVFQNKHVIVTEEQKCVFLSSRNTHAFAWEALRARACSPSGVDLLFRVIRPGGILLRDWLDHFAAGYNFIAAECLQQWGLDLSRFRIDRDARNLASYRPTAFTSPGPRRIGDTLNSIIRFWEIFEPGQAGGFPVLDRHLLRRSLSLVTDRDGLHARMSYAGRLEMMLNALDPKELSTDQWTDFLNYDNLQEIPPILQDANARDDSCHVGHSKHVLARAALLLRVATGSTVDLLNEAGLTIKKDLSFWWTSPAVKRRLWSNNDAPTSFVDLWQDIEDAMDLDNRSPLDSYTLWSNHSREAAILATTERAFLWGLEP